MNNAAWYATTKQSPPTPGGADVTDALVLDLIARKEVGLAKYKTPLQTNNGRDPLIDKYQEALDLALYFKQELMEKYGE